VAGPVKPHLGHPVANRRAQPAEEGSVNACHRYRSP
jgi:hypothetical protein